MANLSVILITDGTRGVYVRVCVCVGGEGTGRVCRIQRAPVVVEAAHNTETYTFMQAWVPFISVRSCPKEI